MAERPGGDNRTLAKPASLNGATAHSISLAVGTTRDTGMGTKSMSRESACRPAGSQPPEVLPLSSEVISKASEVISKALAANGVGLSSPDAVAGSPVTSFNKGGELGVGSEGWGVRSEQ